MVHFSEESKFRKTKTPKKDKLGCSEFFSQRAHPKYYTFACFYKMLRKSDYKCDQQNGYINEFEWRTPKTCFRVQDRCSFDCPRSKCLRDDGLNSSFFSNINSLITFDIPILTFNYLPQQLGIYAQPRN